MYKIRLDFKFYYAIMIALKNKCLVLGGVAYMDNTLKEIIENIVGIIQRNGIDFAQKILTYAILLEKARFPK